MASPAADGPSAAPPSGPRRARPRGWWMIMPALLLANYLVARLIVPEPSSVTVSYTFFKKQVEAGNVEDVTGQGQSIRGTFRTDVTYPPASRASSREAPGAQPPAPGTRRASRTFTTQRPVFADPGLERLLEEKGVTIDAVDESESSWFTLLIGFGPTLLFIGAFVLISRRGSAGGLFSLGRSRAKRYSETQSERLGPISFVAPQAEGLPPAFQHQPYSEVTAELIDAEVRRIVEESHREADRLLGLHRDELEALARALLKAESLNEQEIRDATGLPEPGGGKTDGASRLETAGR